MKKYNRILQEKTNKLAFERKWRGPKTRERKQADNYIIYKPYDKNDRKKKSRRGAQH